MAQLSTDMTDAGEKTIPGDNSRSNYGVRATTTRTANVFRHAQIKALLMRAHNTWMSAGVAIRFQTRSPTKPIATMPVFQMRLRPAAETAYVHKRPG